MEEEASRLKSEEGQNLPRRPWMKVRACVCVYAASFSRMRMLGASDLSASVVWKAGILQIGLSACITGVDGASL